MTSLRGCSNSVMVGPPLFYPIATAVDVEDAPHPILSEKTNDLSGYLPGYGSIHRFK
jgi:hypothetical protein